MRCLAKRPPRTTVATELDHIVPLFKGGADVESNRQGLCSPCHAEKTHEDLGHRVTDAIGVDGWGLDGA